MANILILIPSRLQASRLPNKPLLEIKKKPLSKLESSDEKPNAINSFTLKELKKASPSLEEIKNLQ